MAAERAALQAEVDGGLAACVHALHGIDLPWRPATAWAGDTQVGCKTNTLGFLQEQMNSFSARRVFVSEAVEFFASMSHAWSAYLLLQLYGSIAAHGCGVTSWIHRPERTRKHVQACGDLV